MVVERLSLTCVMADIDELHDNQLTLGISRRMLGVLGGCRQRPLYLLAFIGVSITFLPPALIGRLNRPSEIWVLGTIMLSRLYEGK